MSDEPISEEKPFPRRRVWLGRALLAVLLFLAGFFAVRIGTEIWLNRVLARRAAEHRARGEPVTREDVVSHPIPDEQNTVFYLLRGAAAYEANKEDDLAISDSLYSPPPGMAAVHIDAAALLGRNVAALADLRRARGCRSVAWPDLNVGGVAYAEHISTLRSLEKLLEVAANSARARGDGAAALEYFRDIGACADAVEQQPSPFFHILAMMFYMSQARYGRLLASDLPVSGDASDVRSVASAPTARPADRREVMATIEELLDDKRILMAGSRSMWGDRVQAIGDIERAADGDWTSWDGLPPRHIWGAQASLYPLRPLWLMDMVTVENEAADLCRAFGAGDQPAALAILRALDVRDRHVFLTPTAQQFHAPRTRMVPMQYTALYERHMTAIALAARLHEREVEQGTDAADSTGWIERYLGRWPDDPLRVTRTALVYPGIARTGASSTQPGMIRGAGGPLKDDYASSPSSAPKPKR